MAILEYPIPNCLASTDGSKPGVVAPGATVTCAFKAPGAALKGTDPKSLAVSVSFPVGPAAASGMCAADAAGVKVAV